MYALDEQDWEVIESAVRSHQMSLMQFWGARRQNGSDESESSIGDFVPVVVVHEDRKEEIVEDYQAVMKRFSGALQKLKPTVKRQ